MAKKVTNKKTAAGKGGLANSVKAKASTVITEAEQAGENVLSEVRDGLGAVTDRIAATVKTVSETQAARTLKNLLGEVEEIGSDVIEAVTQKLKQLRGKVETETAGVVPRKATTKNKAAAKKAVRSKKKAANKKVTKKKPAAKKKTAPKRAAPKKKPVVKKKAAPKNKTTATKKVMNKKPTAKSKSAAKKKAALRNRTAAKR
jgi:hypothetical protein